VIEHPDRAGRLTGVLDILVIGAGGHGKEIGSYVRALSDAGALVRLAGYFDDGRPAGPFARSSVVGALADIPEYLNRHPDTSFGYITAVGDNQTRIRLAHQLETFRSTRFSPWTAIHPRAIVGDDAQIGEGTCVGPGAVITAGVVIGKHCIVNVNGSVSHDCVIGDFVNVNPRVAVCGNVKLGRGAYIGAGSTVLPNLSIGAEAIVGAGAVVIRDVPPRVTVVGVPARVREARPSNDRA
jgi:acetyltransferase EpsM